MKRIKVIELIGHLDVGGAEMHVKALAEGLQGRGFHIEVACVKWAGLLEEELRHNGIPVHVMNKKSALDFSVISRLVKLFRERRYDILHTHMFTAGTWGKLSGLISNAVGAIVTTEHTLGGTEKPAKHFIPDYVLSKLTDVFIAPTNQVKQTLIRKARYPQNKIVVIPHGVDLTLFKAAKGMNAFIPGLRDRFNLPIDKPLLGMIGRFSREKAHHLLFEALGRIEGIDVVLCGEGPFEPELREMIRAADLGKRVHFLGRIPHNRLPELYSSLDAVVLPAPVEGFGLAALEGMAMGKPAIASKGAGPEDFIINGRTGYLFNRNDPVDLAEKLRLVMFDKERLRKMGSAARDHVHGGFGMESMLKSVDELFRSIVK